MRATTNRLISNLINLTTESSAISNASNFVQGQNSCYTNYFGTSVYSDASTAILQLRRKLNFSEEAIENLLIEKKDLVDFLEKSINTLSESGCAFSADLKVINDPESDRLLFIYTPIHFHTSTDLSLQQDTEESDSKLYKGILKTLFKYPIPTRKSIVIDSRSL